MARSRVTVARSLPAKLPAYLKQLGLDARDGPRAGAVGSGSVGPAVAPAGGREGGRLRLLRSEQGSWR
jgi:hypothetical protein